MLTGAKAHVRAFNKSVCRPLLLMLYLYLSLLRDTADRPCLLSCDIMISNYYHAVVDQ